MVESPDYISNVFDESIYQLLKKLSILQLKRDGNSNKVIVFKESYNSKAIKYLQNILYKTLFTVLHSPIILPKYHEVQNVQTKDNCNVYIKLSNIVFEMDIASFKEEANNLRSLTNMMSKKNNETVNNVMKLFCILAQPDNHQRESKQLVYDKDEYFPSQSLFQLDNKAVEMSYSGINLFGRLTF